MKLYASERGGRYHQDPSCGLSGAAFRGLPDRWAPVDPADARKRRLRPCRTCSPPPLLSLIRGSGT